MLNIGILGAARIAPEAIIEPAARRDDVTILAVASRSGNAADYAKTHGIERAYSSYDELLADADIDLVYNALAGNQHGPMSIASLEAGKNVLCEKPSAMNAGEAREMVAAAEKTGKRLVEAFHSIYHPAFHYVQDMAKSGRLGTIQSIEAVFLAPIRYSERELRYKWEMGGGALMDLGSYNVRYARSLIGEEPEVVSASATRTQTDVDEGIEAQVRFPSGVTGRLECSMSGDNDLTWFFTLAGEKGTLTYNSPCKPHHGHSIVERIAGEPYRVHTVAGNTTYDYQLEAVVNGLASGQALVSEGDDIVNNMAAIDAIYAAAGFPPR